jgi:hypothetical protein
MSTTTATVTFNTVGKAIADDVLAVVVPIVDLHNPIERYRADRMPNTDVTAVSITFLASNVHEATETFRRVRVAVQASFSSDAWRITTSRSA